MLAPPKSPGLLEAALSSLSLRLLPPADGSCFGATDEPADKNGLAALLPPPINGLLDVDLMKGLGLTSLNAGLDSGSGFFSSVSGFYVLPNNPVSPGFLAFPNKEPLSYLTPPNKDDGVFSSGFFGFAKFKPSSSFLPSKREDFSATSYLSPNREGLD